MIRTWCLIICCLCMISCVKQHVPVHFDVSDPLALNPEIQWAVVVEPYVACYADADYSASVVAHYRKGEILQVEGERTVKVGGSIEKWYAFNVGWLPASSLSIYANKMRAQTAVRQLGIQY